jgi:hypothetical protein
MDIGEFDGLRGGDCIFLLEYLLVDSARRFMAGQQF